MSPSVTVWVGIETAAPDSIPRPNPTQIEVFATEELAWAWHRELRVTMNSPMRCIYEREIRR